MTDESKNTGELDEVLGIKPDRTTNLDYYYISFDGFESSSICGETLEELKRRVKALINREVNQKCLEARIDTLKNLDYSDEYDTYYTINKSSIDDEIKSLQSHQKGQL